MAVESRRICHFEALLPISVFELLRLEEKVVTEDYPIWFMPVRIILVSNDRLLIRYVLIIRSKRRVEDNYGQKYNSLELFGERALLCIDKRLRSAVITVSTYFYKYKRFIFMPTCCSLMHAGADFWGSLQGTYIRIGAAGHQVTQHGNLSRRSALLRVTTLHLLPLARSQLTAGRLVPQPLQCMCCCAYWHIDCGSRHPLERRWSLFFERTAKVLPEAKL